MREHEFLMSPRPLNDVVDPCQLLNSQDGLFKSQVGDQVRLAWNPRSHCFLVRGKFPLPRDKEELILPPPVAGVLGVQLDELPSFCLEVVHPRIPRIPMNPVHMHKLLHGQLMFLAQN